VYSFFLLKVISARIDIRAERRIDIRAAEEKKKRRREKVLFFYENVTLIKNVKPFLTLNVNTKHE
jgi:hypothetical protein